MAPWRGINIQHLYSITTLLTTCPADLPVKPNQELLAAQTAYHTLLATQESIFRPAHHLRFHTEHTTQTPPSQLECGRRKRRQRRFTRTYAHTDIIKHQLEVFSTNVCPSVLTAPCSHPESCMRCAYVSKCDIAGTPLQRQCLPCESADPFFMEAGSTQDVYSTRPLSPEDETMMQAQKTPKAVPAPGDIIFCNSNDNLIIGVVTAALLFDLFTVLMPTQHTQTFSLSNLSLAEEIVNTDNDTADVGGDTGHTPCAVDESVTDAATPPTGDNTARNLSSDFAYALSLGYHKEEYYLLIHTDGVEMLWFAPTTSCAQPHELIQEFLNYSGIQVRSIRFDNAMESGQFDHFKSWAKVKGSVLSPL